jgi:hypothetical protein
MTVVSITPLLKRLWPSPGDNKVTPDEIALAISRIFTDELSPVQTGALLTCLHFTGWDIRADVIAKCAQVMREAASQIDSDELARVIKQQGKPEGDYHGGLVCHTLNRVRRFLTNIIISATLLVLVVTHITLSTFQQPHLYWLPHC